MLLPDRSTAYLDFENLWITNQNLALPSAHPDERFGKLPSREQYIAIHDKLHDFPSVFDAILRDALTDFPLTKNVRVIAKWNSLVVANPQKLRAHITACEWDPIETDTSLHAKDNPVNASDIRTLLAVMSDMAWEAQSTGACIVFGSGDHTFIRFAEIFLERTSASHKVIFFSFRKSFGAMAKRFCEKNIGRAKCVVIDEHPLYREYYASCVLIDPKARQRASIPFEDRLAWSVIRDIWWMNKARPRREMYAQTLRKHIKVYLESYDCECCNTLKSDIDYIILTRELVKQLAESSIIIFDPHSGNRGDGIKENAPDLFTLNRSHKVVKDTIEKLDEKQRVFEREHFLL
jgi:hypothetical protein